MINDITLCEPSCVPFSTLLLRRRQELAWHTHTLQLPHTYIRPVLYQNSIVRCHTLGTVQLYCMRCPTLSNIAWVSQGLTVFFACMRPGF